MRKTCATILLTAVTWLTCPTLQAQDDAETGACFPDIAFDIETVRLQRIAASDERVYFIKSSKLDQDYAPELRNVIAANCPSAEEACRRKAYLVEGDAVLISRTHQDFSCATFVGSNGKSTTGWLPTAQLGAVDHQPLLSADWVGDWKSEPNSADLSIRALEDGRLEISGTAYYGMHDPERVARGAIHTGEVEPTEVSLSGATLVFESGIGNIAWESFDELANDSRCALILQRMGSALLVQDNNQCGGMNVSFSGLYTRSR